MRKNIYSLSVLVWRRFWNCQGTSYGIVLSHVHACCWSIIWKYWETYSLKNMFYILQCHSISRSRSVFSVCQRQRWKRDKFAVGKWKSYEGGALSWNEGAFLVRDNRVLKEPLGRSLRSLAPQRSASLHSLHSLARSLSSRARSLTSFTPSWDSWKSWICVHTVIAFHGNKRVFHLH